MLKRRSVLAGVILAVVAVSGCSKTEDTAPERRIFGEPPVISNVNFVSSQETTTCDVTQFAIGYLCTAAITPDMYTLISPNVEFVVGYTNIHMTVQVADPNSTPTENDILLVTASYVKGIQEFSLLVFDDGSTLDFPKIQANLLPADCSDIDPQAPVCSECKQANFNLKSNDPTANDGLYTRGYAFMDFPGSLKGPAAEDCIMESLQRPAVSTSGLVGQTLSFKIEAVDRSGNIATWPAQPEATVGASTFNCTGDPCACCLITEVTPDSACRQLPGMIGTASSFWGEGLGLCEVAFP